MARGVEPAFVFDLADDPDNGAEWVGAASRVRAEGSGLGKTIVSTVEVAGLGFDSTQTVTEWDRPSRYVFEGDVPFRIRFVLEYAPVEGGTHVTGTVEVDPGRFLPGGAAAAALVGRLFAGDVRRLAALAEQRGGTS